MPKILTQHDLLPQEFAVLAFHGDFASPAILARDMGYPPWVDAYMEHDTMENLYTCISRHKRVILVGYSRGGAIVGDLTHRLSNIAGAVIYEPGPGKLDTVKADFPVFLLWNQLGRHLFRKGTKALNAWKDGCSGDIAIGLGAGFHARLVWGVPPLGHNWDRRLNPVIEDFIEVADIKSSS